MANKFQRYEAVVKLSTGHIVQYHNINTGLYKFHQFLNEKFSSNQRWIFYTVRRKENKEIIGTFKNKTEDKKTTAIKLFLEARPSSQSTGYIITVPFLREQFTINRNIFIANSQVIELGKDFISISEWLFNKVVLDAKKALYEYYLNKGHNITLEELELDKELKLEKFIFVKQGQEEELPYRNYP